MFRRILIFVIFCVATINAQSQYDPQFSQNMFNRLAINPGYAGVSNAINLVALNRNQWSERYAIKTTVFSGDMPVKFFGLNSGVGLNIINDEIGFFTNLSILINYAIKFELDRGVLGIGLKAGIVNQTLDGSKWYFPTEDIFDQNDLSLPQSEVSGSALDAGFGIYYQEKEFYGGISISHLNNPKPDYKGELDFNITGTLYLTGGYNYKVEDTAYEILPSFFYKTDGRSFQIDLNTLVRYKGRYWGGLTYRFQDAIVLFGGVEMKNGVRFGYSYDITTSAVSSAGNGGSHEFMVGYNLDINFEKRTKRYKSVRYL